MKTKRTVGQYVVDSGRPFFRMTLEGKRPYFLIAAPEGTRLDPPAPFIARRVEELRALAVDLRRGGQPDSVIARFVKDAAAATTEQQFAIVAKVATKVVAKTYTATENITAAITFGELTRKWLSGELHALHPDHISRLGDRTAKEYGYLFDRYLKPTLGPVPVGAVQDVELAFQAMRTVPATPQSNSLRRNTGIIIGRVFNLAVWPLRIIKQSPIPRGFLVKKKAGRAKVYLYPREDMQLLGCTDVPLLLRLFYGMLAREGMRVDELARLELSDVDLTNGVLTLDRNKTKEPRQWAMDPGVTAALRLYVAFLHPEPKNPKARLFLALELPYDPDYVTRGLRVWSKALGETHVSKRLGLSFGAVYNVVHGKSRPGPKVTRVFERFVGTRGLPDLPPAPRERKDGKPLIALRKATLFRENLEKAKITRPQLFEHDDVRRHIVIHDLRATFVTVSLAEGKPEAWITDRTGHKSSEMIYKYKRASRQHQELGLGPLAPLCVAIPELSELGRREGFAVGTQPGTQPGRSKKPGAAAAVFQSHPGHLLPPAGGVAYSSHLQDSNQAKEPSQSVSAQKQVVEETSRRPKKPPTVRVQAEADAVATALQTALEEAIAEGRIPEAAEIATALAAREKSKTAPNVVKLSTRRGVR